MVTQSEFQADNILKKVRYRRVYPSNDFIEFRQDEINQSIPDRFEQQVRKYANRLAVKTRNFEYTYDELNKVANRVAHSILELRGEGQETIALLLDHDAPVIAAMFGVLKAGKIHVPLDPTLPHSRVDYILRDSQAELILTSGKNQILARELAGNTIRILNIDELGANISTENPELSIPPEAYAYIIYTSGSTGNPKGVIENHLDVLNFTRTFTNSESIGMNDKLILVGSICFSGSAGYIYPALLNGAALLPFDIKKEGMRELAEWVINEKITLYGSVPSTFRSMVASLNDNEIFPDLRLVRLGGDRANKRDIQLYKKHTPQNCVMRIGLGSSEMKIFRIFFLDKELEIIGNMVPVGYSVDGAEILLLDEDGREAGFYNPGEIVVRSRYISPGYWRKPELTAAVIKPDPEDAEKRLYYTGDMGLMLPDGCLFHIGRKDFQVKIRGYRVETGEVENALLTLGGIKEAAVVSHESDSGEQRLVAYIVPAGENLPPISQLRSALSEILPNYMIPAVFMKLDALPVNVNGKVDRRSLPEPDNLRPELEEAFLAPRDEMELEIAQIWKEILGIDSIGVRDNFLELGGNSILAARTLVQIQKRFGEIPFLTRLLHATTVEQMADILREKDWSPSSSALIALQPNGSRSPLFCIHACGGHGLIYTDLSRHLGNDQPLYILRARGMYGEQKPHNRLKDMAACYIEEIQTVQPEGPYLLCGIGVGGRIAFEMAQQLLATSRKVALLVVMDAADPPLSPRIRSLISASSADFPNRLRSGMFLQRLGRYLKRNVKFYCRKLTYMSVFRRIGFIRRYTNYVEHVRDTIAQASRRYIAKPYPGKIAYFLSEAHVDAFSDSTWHKLAAGGLDIQVVPGEHVGMLAEPHVRVVAELLKPCLGAT